MVKRDPREVTLSDLLAQMTAEQKLLVDDIEQTRKAEERKRQEAANETRVRVREAMARGVSARVIADRLKLSVPRVYQMRAEAE